MNTGKGAVSMRSRALSAELSIVLGVLTLMVTGCGRSNSSARWNRDLTREQLMEMVKHREHQTTAYWEGLSRGSIGENGSSCGMTGLQLRHSSVGLLEHQWDRMKDSDPLFFLPLLDSQDPQIVLTGMHLYTGFDLGYPSESEKSEIAAAFRKHLDNRDSRIRWQVIHTLKTKRWLTVEDVEKGLNDRMPDVAWPSVTGAGRLFEKGLRYSPDGVLLEGDPNCIEGLIEVKRRLAPVLLEHLNHTHFSIRSKCAGTFKAMLKRAARKGSTTTAYGLPPGFPDRIDWIRSDWHTREKTKLQWQNWWAEHSEEALKFTHPPQG